MTEAGKANDKLKEAEKRMRILLKKEQDAIDSKPKKKDNEGLTKLTGNKQQRQDTSIKNALSLLRRFK